MPKKFVRQDTTRHSRLGKKRPKLQRWRKPRGLHNKVRKKRYGYPVQPGVGHKAPKSEKGKIENLTPLMVSNISDLKKAKKDSIVVVASVGAKKKLEILKKAQELKLKVRQTRSKTKTAKKVKEEKNAAK